MDINELFWESSIEEISNGYKKVDDCYTCLLCGEAFMDGMIYQVDEQFYEARKVVQLHLHMQHDSVFDYLLKLDKKYTGLSDHQKELMGYFKVGMADKEIVEKMDLGSSSTVRNHRFKLREKEKQAKVFLSLMSLLNDKEKKQTEERLVHFHKGAKMVDDRYITTETEREKILATFFKDNKLTVFPSKEKRKLIVLQHIITFFDKDKCYTEKEVNTIVKDIYPDFTTIRRYLIQYGFMDRNQDCTEYWVKG